MTVPEDAYTDSGRRRISAAQFTGRESLAPPARLAARFSWTRVIRSSSSTRSASRARQASSSCATRWLRDAVLLSAPQGQEFN
ncbi:hypothetical protein EYF80_053698 [Liparis tanakae]|uniref:Uncharacterized protein n=1 Tax=Liparis tanakae TaxID=230148 RepID=A0A4Z2F4H0_9TELE|nr:hypothetical protein EYF80_053698 [Liparis tanakae]